MPCGAVRDVAEVLEDPQISARAMIEAVDHTTLGVVRVLGMPIKLSDTPGAVRTAPPTLGQHTDQILRTDLSLLTQKSRACARPALSDAPTGRGHSTLSVPGDCPG